VNWIMQELAVPETIAFGPFVLEPGRRALLAGGEKLPLSSRAFDILLLLVTHRDRVVSKDEIIATVWRGVAVEENNLAVQVSSLRRALAERSDGQTMILTIPGQGYRFVGRVEEHIPAFSTASPADASPGPEATRTMPSPAGVVVKSRSGVIRAMFGAAAVAGLVLIWLGASWLLGSPPAAPRLSIAVLPFRNLGEDAKQDYLAEAVSDDLTTDLSHLPGSVVIARESSDVYRGRAVPAEQIGRALNVRYLLEGSLRGVDGVFRINAQLIDARNGAHLWADRFDVPGGKISEAQTAIVRNIANALDVKLVAIESDRSLHERPNDPDALDLYFRARSIRDGAETLDAFTEAQKLLERAVALQPSFVDALTDLSLVLLAKITDFDDPDDGKDRAQAKQLIAKSLTLAPKNANALTAQGWLETIEGQVSEGDASYLAAIAADPNNVTARAGLALNDWYLGKPEETIAALTEVLRLDPQGPATKRRLAVLGMAYFMVGKWQDSIDFLLRGLAGDPDVSGAGGDRLEFSHLFLIAAYVQSGDKARAVNLYADYKRLWPRRSVWRLSSYFCRAQLEMHGFQALKAALEAVGMPDYAKLDDLEASSAQETDARQGDFDPAPPHVSGATAIDVAELMKMTAKSPRPVLLDVGIGAATIADAVWIPNPDAAIGGLDDFLNHLSRRPGTPVIVVGTGIYGWSGYRAASLLVHAGVGPVMWLRGGEEALAQSGIPTVNRR